MDVVSVATAPVAPLADVVAQTVDPVALMQALDHANMLLGSILFCAAFLCGCFIVYFVRFW